jgi:hypothetical protein
MLNLVIAATWPKALLVPLVAVLQQNLVPEPNDNNATLGLGVVVGLVAGATVVLSGGAAGDKSKERRKWAAASASWAALTGAIICTIAVFVSYSVPTLAVAQVAAGYFITYAAWCALWGLLGGVIGRKMHERREPSSSTLTQTPHQDKLFFPERLTGQTMPLEGSKLKTFDDALAVYEDCDFNSPVLNRLPSGAEFQLGHGSRIEGREWLEAELSDGKKDYVLAASVRSHAKAAD